MYIIKYEVKSKTKKKKIIKKQSKRAHRTHDVTVLYEIVYKL